MGGERPLVVPEYNRGTKKAAVVCECENPISSLSVPLLAQSNLFLSILYLDWIVQVIPVSSYLGSGFR